MKFLIIGLGAAGQRHARNLREILGDRIDLCAYRQRRTGGALTDSLSVEPNVTPEQKHGIEVFRDLDQALLAAPDAVIVANPSSQHLATARRAAEAGCALFVEKPVSHRWDGVPDLAAYVARRRLVTFVGYQWRFHPLLARVKGLLDGGTLGRVIAANAVYGEYMPGWHPYEDYRQTYAARSELGGGVLLTQIHDMDYLGWLIGWPDQVFSLGGHLSNLEIDVEDTASTLMRCGVQGRHVPVHLHQDYLQRPPSRRCEILLEGGKACFDLLNGSLEVFDAEGASVVREDTGMFRRNDMFLSEMRHFLACLDGTQTSLISLAEGCKSLAVAVAARKSLLSGHVEAVEYLQTDESRDKLTES